METIDYFSLPAKVDIFSSNYGICFNARFDKIIEGVGSFALESFPQRESHLASWLYHVYYTFITDFFRQDFFESGLRKLNFATVNEFEE